MNMKKRGGNRGQVWIETVMYTLIAFAIMGLVLAYARPKIEELQDRAIIEQSISMLKDIDSTLLNMGGAGNQRVIEISIKKGDLKIDGKKDLISFEMESGFSYSEPDEIISNGNVDIQTTKSGKFNIINLTMNFYDDYNITNTKKDDIKTISKSPVAYTLTISNRGTESFPTTFPCTVSNDCNSYPDRPDITIFTSECVTSYCQYTSKRPTIDFELS
jgi:type II secretory pathway pseudopilin PulG